MKMKITLKTVGINLSNFSDHPFTFPVSEIASLSFVIWSFWKRCDASWMIGLVFLRPCLKWLSDDPQDFVPVESHRSKYGNFCFDSLPDVLFSLRSRLPVPRAVHCARLLRLAPARLKGEAMRLFEGGRRCWCASARLLNGSLDFGWTWTERTVFPPDERCCEHFNSGGCERLHQSANMRFIVVWMLSAWCTYTCVSLNLF